MPDVTRTFIAVALPANIASSVDRLRRRLEPEMPGARWVETGHYHFTLAFLGDVENRDLAVVCKAVGEAATGLSPFELKVSGLGTFPEPSRPRTLWVGVEGPGVGPLRELQGEVAQAVARVGYRADDKDAFQPHLTLARFKIRGSRDPSAGPPAPDLTPLVRRYGGWSAGTFRVGEVVAFSSVLRPEGPEYAALSRARLKGRKNES